MYWVTYLLTSFTYKMYWTLVKNYKCYYTGVDNHRKRQETYNKL